MLFWHAMRTYLWPAKCRVRVHPPQLRVLGCYSVRPVMSIAHHRGQLYIVLQQWWNGNNRGETGETRRETCSTAIATAFTRESPYDVTGERSSFSAVRNRCPAAWITAGPVPSPRVRTAIIHIACHISSYDNARVIWNEVRKLPFHEGILETR